jgi:hypothetical protein
MKNSTWIKGGLVSVALMFGASTASATESGFYVGLNLGKSSFDVQDDVEEYLGSADGLEDSDTAWSLAMGYRFTPYFGLEGSYLDFGTTTVNQSDTETGPGGYVASYSYTSEGSANGLAVALIAAVPAGSFEFNARLGLFFAKSEYEENGSIVVRQGNFVYLSENFDYDESDSTTETLYGLGVGYTIGEHFHIRFDWVNVPDVGDGIDEDDDDYVDEYDVSVWTLGFQYRF